MYCDWWYNALLVVVNDFDVSRSRRTVRPFKTDSPLVVDAYAELSLAITGQCFETIAGQGRKILKCSCCLQPVQL